MARQILFTVRDMYWLVGRQTRRQPVAVLLLHPPPILLFMPYGNRVPAQHINQALFRQGRFVPIVLSRPVAGQGGRVLAGPVIVNVMKRGMQPRSAVIAVRDNWHEMHLVRTRGMLITPVNLVHFLPGQGRM